MKRAVSLKEISDGRLYGPNDLVKADCRDCEGCSACCHGMGDSILLDPLDLFRLSTHLKKSFEELLADAVELHVVDGLIQPNLKMAGEREQCVYLTEAGRCGIHPFRPGFCRLFPLGRYYEGRSFRYFLQVHECKKQDRAKVKVKKWLDIPDYKNYETFVLDWHCFLKDMEQKVEQCQEDEKIRQWNLELLNRFYVTPYGEEEDFYEEFRIRLAKARADLGLHEGKRE